jgi:hypothetical protein
LNRFFVIVNSAAYERALALDPEHLPARLNLRGL